MPFKARRRCFYFDPDGEPIEDGCPRTRSTCRFVHPDDSSWAELQPYYKKRGKSESPSWVNRGRDSGWGEKSDRERDRERDRHKGEDVKEGKDKDRGRERDRARERDDRDRDKEYQRHDRDEESGRRGLRSRSRSGERFDGYDYSWSKERDRAKDYLVKQGSYGPKGNGEHRIRVKEEHAKHSLASPLSPRQERRRGPPSLQTPRSHTDGMQKQPPPITPVSPIAVSSAPSTSERWENGMNVDHNAIYNYMNGNKTNGTNGHANGHTNGYSNGYTNGHSNGHPRSNGDAMDIDTPSTPSTTSNRTINGTHSHTIRPNPPRLSFSPTLVSTAGGSFSIPWIPDPPPPTAEPPLAPPAPLPEEPDFFKEIGDDVDEGSVNPVDNGKGKEEGQEAKELRELWSMRLTLMADAIAAEENVVSIQEELKTAREVMEAFQRSQSNITSLGDASSQIAELEAALKEAEEGLNLALDRIAVQQNSWPVYEQEPGEVWEINVNEEEEEERYKEMVKYVKELQGTAEEMRGTLMEIVEAAIEKNDEEDVDIRKIADDEWGDLKRVVPGQEPPQKEPTPRPAEPTPEEQQLILERLVEIESNLALHCDFLANHDTELIDSVEGIVETRVDDYFKDYERKLGKVKEREKELMALHDQAVLETDEVAGEIASLENQLARLDEEIENKIKEKEELNVSLELLNNVLTANNNKHEATANALDALRKDLHTYLSQPPSPPPSPSPVDRTTPTDAQLQYILSGIEQPVKIGVRDAIKPLIEDTRTELEKTLRENIKDVEDALVGRLNLTKKVMEAIYKRIVLNKEGLGAANSTIVE